MEKRTSKKNREAYLEEETEKNIEKDIEKKRLRRGE